MRSYAAPEMVADTVEAAALVMDLVVPVMATLGTAVLATETLDMVDPVTLGTPVIPEILATAT